MQMHVGMALESLEPAVVLGLVGIEIVEDDVNFLFPAVGVYNAVRDWAAVTKSTALCQLIAKKVCQIISKLTHTAFFVPSPITR